MGKYYRDSEQLLEIYGHFLRRVLTEQNVGPKMARANLVIKFFFTDPDCEITVDLKSAPPSAEQYGSYHLGPTELKEDVWSKQSADHSHRFWHGKINPLISIAKGEVKHGGNLLAMLRLLPAIKPAFRLFPQVLKEMGYDELVLRS